MFDTGVEDLKSGNRSQITGKTGDREKRMTENFRGRKGIIIGGGASGLMAAITAAEQGAAVTVIEHTARRERRSCPQETENAT